LTLSEYKNTAVFITLLNIGGVCFGLLPIALRQTKITIFFPQEKKEKEKNEEKRVGAKETKRSIAKNVTARLAQATRRRAQQSAATAPY